MSPPTAVVLARGLGTRMRRDDHDAALDPVQRARAASGIKAMIPDAKGRPFLDHILSSFADAGITRAVLVVAPDAEVIRQHYHDTPPRRLGLEWAVQEQPRGTADAVLAAEPLVGREPFLVANADNLYPVAALTSLIDLGEPGLVAFDRDALLQDGGIDPDRIKAFAMLRLDPSGYLVDLVEKPDEDELRAFGGGWVSMNLWRFDHRIFAHCRAVPLSVRGELELPQAVMHALRSGATFRAVTMHAGVLDLSQRADIAAVAARLGERTPHP